MLDREGLIDSYWNKELSLTEIANLTGIDPDRIFRLMRKYRIPTRTRSESIKLSWAKNPTSRLKWANLEPTRELSYLVGAVWGDGTLGGGKGGRWKISLFVKDKDFAEKFNECLLKVLGKKYPLYYCCGRWGVEACNKELNFFLGNKDRCREIVEKFPSDFLRGLFDAEGGVSRNEYCVSLTNTDLKLLEYARELLRRRSIRTSIRLSHPAGYASFGEGKKIVSRKNVYQLRVRNRNSVLEFSKQVGFSIGRKKERLVGLVRRGCVHNMEVQVMQLIYLNRIKSFAEGMARK